MPYIPDPSKAEPVVFPQATVKVFDQMSSMLPKKTSGYPITIADVEMAQQAWGNALVAISSTYTASGKANATILAQEVLDAAYGYKLGMNVLFKPTLTTGNQTFRPTNEGALAYFVGGNTKYPNDSGFALKGWINVTSVRNGIFVSPSGDVALSMGKVYIGNRDGSTTIVDKTYVLRLYPKFSLSFVVHFFLRLMYVD